MIALHPFCWQNGELIPSGDAQVSPLQTGLLTGWGLFSTLRIYQGVPFALADHWERLSADGRRLQVETEGLWPAVERGWAELIERNQAAEAVGRIYLIRNRGGLLDSPQTRATDVLLFSRGLRAWETTAALQLRPHGRHAAAPLAGTKTLAWAGNLTMMEEAVAAGFDDALLLNERGEVAECTSANVFVACGGVLRTPPLAAGALPGVSRRRLMAAGAREGLRIEEATITPEDLWRAEEVFITSTTREVQPVARIDQRPIPQGPLAAQAAAIFKKEVRSYIEPRADPRIP